VLDLEKLTDDELAVLKDSLFSLPLSDKGTDGFLCIKLYNDLDQEHYRRHYMKRGINRWSSRLGS
jgi:hypothetical protein